MLMRRLLDGERFSHAGRFYTFTDALIAPRPIQAHLPIMVGGSGPKKTLRTVALRADAWNTSGWLEEVARARTRSCAPTVRTSAATRPRSSGRSASRSSCAIERRMPRRRSRR